MLTAEVVIAGSFGAGRIQAGKTTGEIDVAYVERGVTDAGTLFRR